MTNTSQLQSALATPSRRGFLVQTSLVMGAFSFGFHIPHAQAAAPAPEVNAWVVIKPDESVIIRIARQ